MKNNKFGIFILIALMAGTVFFFFRDNTGQKIDISQRLGKGKKVTTLIEAESEFIAILGSKFYSESKLYDLKSLKEDLLEMKRKGVQ